MELTHPWACPFRSKENDMKIANLFGALVLGSTLSLAACGGNQAETAPPATPATATPAGEHGEHGDHHGAPSAATGPMKAPGEAAVGDTTKCPVSGEEFVVTATSPKVEHNGKTYYFCCSGCEKKFQASPDKFLNKT